jgi:tetratricopeptide (TPR) repeat protein
MSGTLRKIFLVFPLMLVFSLTAWAQTAAFEGTVKGPDGKPVAGAVMKIERQDVKGNYQVKTDKKGHYFYGGLPLGNYKITAVVDGMERGSSSGRTKVGETIDVSFDLTAEGSAAPVQAAAAPTGMSAAEKADREKAEKANSAAMAKNKALTEAFNAGKAAAAAKDWDAAIDGFTKASEVDPMQHVVWANLGDAYASRAKAKTGDAQNADLQKSAESFQKAIAIKPEEAAYHNNYGQVLAQSRKLDEAQAEYTKAAQADPTRAGQYYFNMGATLVNAGNGDAASAAFKKAIETDPNYADAYYQYGLSLMGKATADSSGKITAPAGTQEAFQKYLDLKPDGPYAQPSKDMIASLGGTVQTNFSTKPAAKGNKK